MDFNELIRERYSCKKYSDRKLEDEKLQLILEAGRQAPTAKNLQGQHIYVAQSPEALSAIDAVTPCRYNAGTVLVVTYDVDNQYIYPGGKRTSYIEDASIVATHMMLQAAAIGVNSCWVNCFDPDMLHERLQLPTNIRIVMLMDLGYAASDGTPLPNHAIRKPLSETVTMI